MRRLLRCPDRDCVFALLWDLNVINEPHSSSFAGPISWRSVHRLAIINFTTDKTRAHPTVMMMMKPAGFLPTLHWSRRGDPSKRPPRRRAIMKDRNVPTHTHFKYLFNLPFTHHVKRTNETVLQSGCPATPRPTTQSAFLSPLRVAYCPLINRNMLKKEEAHAS